MSVIGRATLESDENGLVTLQCDRCKSRFNMDCQYLNNELNGDICCPVCGISESLNTFYPEEVIEEAKRIAAAEVERMIANAFKGLDSKHIKIMTPSTQKVDTDIKFKNRDYDMHLVEVACCKRKIGLKSTDITAGFYCPYCGRIVK